MRIISSLLVLIVVLLGLTFAMLNSQPVTINYYIGVSTLPLSMLTVFILMIGAFLGLSASLVFYRKYKKENRKLRRALKAAEAEYKKQI